MSWSFWMVSIEQYKRKSKTYKRTYQCFRAWLDIIKIHIWARPAFYTVWDSDGLGIGDGGSYHRPSLIGSRDSLPATLKVNEWSEFQMSEKPKKVFFLNRVKTESSDLSEKDLHKNLSENWLKNLWSFHSLVADLYPNGLWGSSPSQGSKSLLIILYIFRACLIVDVFEPCFKYCITYKVTKSGCK